MQVLTGLLLPEAASGMSRSRASSLLSVAGSVGTSGTVRAEAPSLGSGMPLPGAGLPCADTMYGHEDDAVVSWKSLRGLAP